MLGCYRLLDFKKAFDTVSHELLLSKLDHYSIRRSHTTFLLHFFTARKHLVSFSKIKSTNLSVTYGVLQGLILRPLLFSII